MDQVLRILQSRCSVVKKHWPHNRFDSSHQQHHHQHCHLSICPSSISDHPRTSHTLVSVQHDPLPERRESVRKLIKSYPLWANRDIGYVIMKPTARPTSAPFSGGSHFVHCFCSVRFSCPHRPHIFYVTISLVSIADTGTRRLGRQSCTIITTKIIINVLHRICNDIICSHRLLLARNSPARFLPYLPHSVTLNQTVLWRRHISE